MPDNAARKKRARMLSRAMDVSYTAALRGLDSGSSPAAQRLMGPGDAVRRFGRPVGVITRPVLPWPMLIGTEGRADQLTGIRLCYGPRSRPKAFMLTNCPRPGAEPDAFALARGLQNFMATHLRHLGIGDEPRDTSALTAAAPLEIIEVSLDAVLVTATRVRARDFEAIEIPYAGGSIVYCGAEGASDDMCFGLDRPPRTRRSTKPSAPAPPAQHHKILTVHRTDTHRI